MVGRFKIDNYLMALPHINPEFMAEYPNNLKGGLIDSSSYSILLLNALGLVYGVHIGMSGYMKRSKTYRYIQSNHNWNLQFIPHVDNVGGTLRYADYVFRSL